MNLQSLFDEVNGYIKDFDIEREGEHLWTNYEQATSILSRLTEIRNEIAWLELNTLSTPDMRKFRTTILDPTIDRFEKIAVYESRKITARQVEASLERG